MAGMKVWGDKSRGNPMRVAIFLEEKGIDIPFVPVDLLAGEHRSAEFRTRNPAGLVPVLELDDGTCIAETMAICRFLERLHPDRPLMGGGPLDEALVEMWQRRVELQFLLPTAAVFRHSVAYMQALEPIQIKEWADLNRPRVMAALDMFEAQLRDHPFITGQCFTVADITAVLAFWLMKLAGLDVPEHCPSVMRWRAELLARQSVATIVRQRGNA